LNVLSPSPSPDAVERPSPDAAQARSPEAAPPPADRWAPPTAGEKPALWRRWGISLTVALLLHAAIATVLVLAWRKFATPNPPGPVIVELPPPEAQPNAEPAEPTFATTGADAGRSDAAERAAIDHPFAELTTRSRPAEESEPTFAARDWEAAPTAQNAGQKPAEIRTATGGGEVRPAPGAQVGGPPIDTRIIPSFGPPGKKAPRKLGRSLSPLGRPAKQAGAQAAPSRRLSSLPGSVVINAVGARVEDRVRAAIARANASGNGPRNAVGNTITTNAGNAAAGAAESVVINAVGMALHVHPAVSPPANGAVGTGATAVPGGRTPAAGVNGGAVNGTGMGHVATRAGAIGGPARNVPGALNGTDFHPRHP
jgi:hypothetical protein